MTPLAGFLDVLLRGLGTVGLSAAVGGLVYVLLVLRPSPGAGGLAAAARARALAQRTITEVRRRMGFLGAAEAG